MTQDETSQSVFHVLRHRSFRLFWTANLISGVGVWMQHLAQSWLIYDLSGSSFYLGLLGFASLFPILIFSLLGGVLADRINRRIVLIITQSTLMMIALFLSGLTWYGLITPWLILMLVFISGIVVALNSPAYQAIIPDLVPSEQLAQAIALNSIQFNLSRILGHAVAGGIVALTGVVTCFLLNGFTYIFMIASLCVISCASGHIHQDRELLSSRLREGVKYVISHPSVFNLVLLSSVISLLGLPYFFFLPVFAKEVLNAGAAGLGILTASVSVGALAGGFLMPAVSARIGTIQAVSTCTIGFWLSLVAFIVSPQFYLSCGFLVLLGLMLVITLSTSNRILQEQTPSQKRGRVMSFQSLATNGLAPVGSFLVGMITEIWTTQESLLMLSMAGLLISGFILVRLNTARFHSRADAADESRTHHG